MTEIYTYQKKRKDFGKPCQFSDTEIKHCGYFPQNKDQNTNDQYKQRNPNFIQLDNISELSEHTVNTERVKTGDRGMNHKEGGWPSNVDPTEPQETNKFKKKIEKDQVFAQSVKELCGTVERCIYQNNQIDLFEEYFQNEKSEHVVENLSSKTTMLFKDDCEVCKRAVSEISWHPDGSQKVAVSYAILRFQQMPDKMPTQAYIWNLENPNNYDLMLKAPSPVTNIAYNTKIQDTLGGGCYNGLLAFWDERKGSDPTAISPVQKSHYDPITHFQWLMSRTGQECVTSSTDGRVMWWDLRQLDNGPVEILNIYEQQNDTATIGGTVLEYNVEAGPSKFLIGTEGGTVLTANKKPKKDVEITTRYGLEQGRHLGPVYALNRSIQNPKYFMSVGDWSTKIWVEDLKVPIIRTKYHGSYLSDGMWSPTRPGAFFLARRDGWMDVWDYYYRQNEIAFSHKVSDAPLTCLKININAGQGGGHAAGAPTGKLVAVGDQDGTVTVLELCDSLYIQQPKEKEIIFEMFDREMRKEKNLEAIKKQTELLKKTVQRENVQAKEKWEKKKVEMINEVETKFQLMLADQEKNKIEDEFLQELDSPTGFKRKPDDPKEAGQKEEQKEQKVEQQQQQQQAQQQSQQQDNKSEKSDKSKNQQKEKSQSGGDKSRVEDKKDQQ